MSVVTIPGDPRRRVILDGRYYEAFMLMMDECWDRLPDDIKEHLDYALDRIGV